MPKVSMPLIFLAFAFTIGQTLFRSIRYRMLLSSSMSGCSVPSHRHMFMATLARNMLVDILPGRIGELGYVALLNMGFKVSIADGLMSLAVSFVFDLMALAAIVFLFLASGALTNAGILTMIYVIAGLGLITVVCWAAVFKGLSISLPVLRRLGARSRRKFWGKFLELLEKTDTAIHAVRRHRKMKSIMVLSLAVRACKYIGMFICFLAVTRRVFPDMARAEPWRVLTAQLFSEAGSSLPLPTLMGFGSYEAGGTAAWTMFGFNAAQAALVVLVVHICSQVIDYTLGVLGMIAVFWSSRWSKSKPVSALSSIPIRRPGLKLTIVAMLAIIGICAANEYRRFSKLGAVRAPRAGTALEPQGRFTTNRVLAELNARVVWSSNREGQHDLFEMTLPLGVIRRLTTNPHVDSFPAYSPDGKRIAFARSQHTWVSQRNSVPWDIYLLEPASGQERLLARNGIAPRWRDEYTVVFERGGKAIVQCDIRTGRQKNLIKAGSGGIPANVRLHSPSINPRTGELALTIRGAMRMTAIAVPEKGLQKLGGGCQASWLPDLSGVYWVDRGGRMTNQILVRQADLPQKVILDLPEPFSHEYFPRFSADGHWLVLAASASGHEHDTADYEIFIWRANTPARAAVRLTYHTGNDCWPDIFVETP